MADIKVCKFLEEGECAECTQCKYEGDTVFGITEEESSDDYMVEDDCGYPYIKPR